MPLKMHFFQKIFSNKKFDSDSNIFKNVGKRSLLQVKSRLGLVGRNVLDAVEIYNYISDSVQINNHLQEFSKQNCIKTLQLISSYRGLRHLANMPVRGQRTHTNSKTRRKYKVS